MWDDGFSIFSTNIIHSFTVVATGLEGLYGTVYQGQYLGTDGGFAHYSVANDRMLAGIEVNPRVYALQVQLAVLGWSLVDGEGGGEGMGGGKSSESNAS